MYQIGIKLDGGAYGVGAYGTWNYCWQDPLRKQQKTGLRPRAEFDIDLANNATRPWTPNPDFSLRGGCLYSKYVMLYVF